MIENEKMASLFENEMFVKELKEQTRPEQVRDCFAKMALIFPMRN